jgi:hypothetical protein
MPAVQLARLKKEVDALLASFDQPLVFLERFDELLDRYADRAYRAGQSGAPKSLLRAYHAPPPVLRQIHLALAGRAADSPQQALALCAALWQAGSLEGRQLAVQLLGRISGEQLEQILALARAWAEAYGDDRLGDDLLTHGMAGVRRSALVQYLALAEGWLKSRALPQRKLGLRALAILVDEAGYQNLPPVYNLLAGQLTEITPELRPYALDLLRSLARRSPQETAVFIQQALTASRSPQVSMLARQALSELPEALQARIRQALRDTARR